MIVTGRKAHMFPTVPVFHWNVDLADYVIVSFLKEERSPEYCDTWEWLEGIHEWS